MKVPYMVLLLIQTVLGLFPKVLWQFWGQNLEESSLNMKILVSKQKLLPNWEIRYINNKNVSYWLQQIPYYQGTPHGIRYSGITNNFDAFRSDYYRLLLLSYFGGVWTDWDLILTQDFSWLDDLKNQQNILNKYGQQPDVFMPRFNYYGSQKKVQDLQLNREFIMFPGFEVYFMAAKPGSKLLRDWLQQYWDGVNKDAQQQIFFLKNHYIYEKAMKLGIQLGGLVQERQRNYLFFMISLQIVIQMKQRQLDALGCSPRLLAVQYYNIWTVQSPKTFSLLQVSFDWNFVELLKAMIQTDINLIKEKSMFPRYGIQLSGTFMNMNKLVSNSKLSIFQRYLALLQFAQTTKRYLKCPDHFQLKKNSILSKLILQPGAQDMGKKEQNNNGLYLTDQCPDADHMSKLYEKILFISFICGISVPALAFLVVTASLILVIRKKKLFFYEKYTSLKQNDLIHDNYGSIKPIEQVQGENQQMIES